jgi:hypothetical protein
MNTNFFIQSTVCAEQRWPKNLSVSWNTFRTYLFLICNFNSFKLSVEGFLQNTYNNYYIKEHLPSLPLPNRYSYLSPFNERNLVDLVSSHSVHRFVPDVLFVGKQKYNGVGLTGIKEIYYRTVRILQVYLIRLVTFHRRNRWRKLFEKVL